MKKIKFTDEELIEEFNRGKPSNQLLANTFGCTRTNIQNRRSKLGLVAHRPSYNGDWDSKAQLKENLIRSKKYTLKWVRELRAKLHL